MEQPDVNGYVNIKWPSKNVPHGGIFHTRITESTQVQQKYLKVLIEESKLSIAQRQKDNLGLRQNEKKVDRQQVSLSRPIIRPRTSRRRSLSAIRASGIYDDDLCRPTKRGEDREKMIEQLANMMALGDSQEQQQTSPLKVAKQTNPKLPTSKERWNELLTQIRERVEWLAEMEFLGQASPHRDIINDQIAERMRVLDGLGVDSECSSTRSTASGFSTTRSTEKIKICNRSKKTEGSIKSSDRQSTARSSAHGGTKDENVAAYSQFSPLQYSPRRRV